jgi:hypothetical protein
MASIKSNLPNSARGGNRPGARLADLRAYLRSIESLAREARRSTDCRVLVSALRVLALQSITIARIEGRA